MPFISLRLCAPIVGGDRLISVARLLRCIVRAVRPECAFTPFIQYMYIIHNLGGMAAGAVNQTRTM